MNESLASFGKKYLLLALLLGFAVRSASASDPIPAPKQKKPIALVGGRIHTVSGAVIPNGMIVFANGKITAVGSTIAIPSNAERIDVTGKEVYPGLIDSYTQMGLLEISLGGPGTNDAGETGEINPNIRVEVAIHPESEMIPVARSGGIAISATAPIQGIISGTSAAMMMDGWTWEEMTLKAPLALVMTWPAMTYVPNPFSQQPKEEWQRERDRKLSLIEKTFADARAYLKAKKAPAAGGKPRLQFDIRLEALIPILEGSVPVMVLAQEFSQIQAAITWAESEQVRLIVAGGRDAWRVSNLLREKNIPVVVTNVLNSPGRPWEEYDLAYSLPQKLQKEGIRFCIAGDSFPPFARNLRHHAGTASAFGLTKEEALRGITLDAAKILGIDSQTGSIEVGKDATLIVSDGNILELSTKVERMFIQGRTIDLSDRHKKLHEKYTQKYRQLGER